MSKTDITFIIIFHIYHVIYSDLFTGTTPPKSRAKLNDGCFSSWDTAIYEACSLNMVTVKKGTKGSGANKARYDGKGRIRTRGIPKSVKHPNGITEEDYDLVLRCTCTEWSRTALVCEHTLITLHDMGKLNIFAENASLIIKKTGRPKHRGMDLDRDDLHKPSTYPAGIISMAVKIQHYSGIGFITGE